MALSWLTGALALLVLGQHATASNLEISSNISNCHTLVPDSGTCTIDDASFFQRWTEVHSRRQQLEAEPVRSDAVVADMVGSRVPWQYPDVAAAHSLRALSVEHLMIAKMTITNMNRFRNATNDAYSPKGLATKMIMKIVGNATKHDKMVAANWGNALLRVSGMRESGKTPAIVMLGDSSTNTTTMDDSAILIALLLAVIFFLLGCGLGALLYSFCEAQKQAIAWASAGKTGKQSGSSQSRFLADEDSWRSHNHKGPANWKDGWQAETWQDPNTGQPATWEGHNNGQAATWKKQNNGQWQAATGEDHSNGQAATPDDHSSGQPATEKDQAPAAPADGATGSITS